MQVTLMLPTETVCAVLWFSKPSLGTEGGGLSQPDLFQYGNLTGAGSQAALTPKYYINIYRLANTVTSGFPDDCFLSSMLQYWQGHTSNIEYSWKWVYLVSLSISLTIPCHDFLPVCHTSELFHLKQNELKRDLKWGLYSPPNLCCLESINAAS